MTIDIISTTDRLSRDPVARRLVEHLEKNAASLQLEQSAIYSDFPVYTDNEGTAYGPDLLLVSPSHGVIPIRSLPSGTSDSSLSLADATIGQFSSLLFSRFLKSPILHTFSQLRFTISPVLFQFDAARKATPLEIGSRIVTSLSGVETLLAELRRPSALGKPIMDEVRSVIEGAKALTRPQKRIITDPNRQKMAAALQKLEAEIANFDQHQRRAALLNVTGPQRIRGLAGSGKTVILAMKAANLHMIKPDARILVTFHTTTLAATMKTLTAKFYRHFKDEDPDWDLVHVRHSWGGAALGGTYSEACRRAGMPALNFGQAAYKVGNKRALEHACRELLDKGVAPYYDHVLIDEGQDLPASFYELCFHLTVGERDQKPIVFAYDELQNVFDVKMPDPEQLFGTGPDGEPNVSLQRSSQRFSGSAINDVILRKCYRNQREVLVTAHCLGLGIYGKIVQMLESAEHWDDVGYQVLSGAALKVGTPVRLTRPEENSPVNLDTLQDTPVIDTHLASSFEEEIAWVIDGIQAFLTGGLKPEDILVIALDSPWKYLPEIARRLHADGVETNDVTPNRRGEPFTVQGKVTLSAAYKAKGNETAAVFVTGVHGISTRSRSGRNTFFAAFTRTKAWLRVSGATAFGPHAKTVLDEIAKARKLFPYIEFNMPDLAEIETIQRGLTADAAKIKKGVDAFRKELLAEGVDPEVIEDLIAHHGLDGLNPARPQAS